LGQLRRIIAGLVASTLLSSLAPVERGHAAAARTMAKPGPKSKPKPPAPSARCEMPKFRIVVDVGTRAEGATAEHFQLVNDRAPLCG